MSYLELMTYKLHFSAITVKQIVMIQPDKFTKEKLGHIEKYFNFYDRLQKTLSLYI